MGVICSGVLLGSGAVLVVLASIGSVYWSDIFFAQLTRFMVVTDRSLSFDIWKETPIPMYLDFYMWNVTNAAEVIAGNGQVKPQLVQLGPYVFIEKQYRTNLTWNAENSTVTYFNNRTWHYVPERSNGSLDDQITNVNVVIATAAYIMRLQPFIVRPAVNAFLSLMHENLMITASVRDWVFDGVQDPVLDFADDYNIDLGIPYDKFGWFYLRNNSETFDGSFNMETGAAELVKLGNIAQWNYLSHTQFDGECGAVKGSTGELWPPGQDRDEISIFASDLCTYMTLQRDGEMEYQGITGSKFIANDSVFDNGHHYPETACFCADPGTADCMPSGALNVSLCRFSAPAFVSFPHFYNADPSYLEKVEGLSPSREEHEFYMVLEQYTGIPVLVRAQLQINILLRHVTGMPIANSLPDDTLMPMFWFTQEVALTDELAGQARLALMARTGGIYFMLAFVAVGAIMVAAGTGLLLRRHLSSRSQPLITTTGDDQAIVS